MKKISEIQIVIATAIVVCLCVGFPSYHFGKSSAPTTNAEVQYWQSEYNEVLVLARGLSAHADEVSAIAKECTSSFTKFKNGE